MVRRLRSISRGVREVSKPTFKKASKQNKKVFKILNKARKALRK